MIVGYVFSRKDKKEMPIIRAGPNESNLDIRIYLFLKEFLKCKFTGSINM